MVKLPRISNDAVHWFMNDLASRIIAESGNPNDRFHLGKLMLQSLKDDPDFIVQIDGATGESVTSAEILEKTVRCAVAMRNFGLQTGDVMILMAPSHVDLAIPFQAALFLGVIIAAVDRTLGVNELQDTFNVDRPKIVFCQSEKAPDIQVVLNALELDTHIVVFDTGDYLCSFADFLEQYGDDSSVEDFKPNDFDPDETIACLIATSGTTGLPKAAAGTHKNFAITAPYWWGIYQDFPAPVSMAMIGSPLQWLTALVNFIVSPILRYTRLQTSQAMTQEHAYYLINKYRGYVPKAQKTVGVYRTESPKPAYTILSPTFMTTLIKPGERDQCDFSCFISIVLGGSAVSADALAQIKEIASETDVINGYGMSELTSLGFAPGIMSPPGSCGRPLGCFQYRIINTETNEDIFEPHIPGELWIKGPGIFKEYYNNPEATAETFAEDRWFKTGDTFYRDENWNFFFVERIKLLLKYKSNQISPVELENVIRQHPGVHDVAVTGIPDPECGDLPVACVVRHPDSDVTAQDIKDLVKDSLSDSKQLRGGVIFVTDIPMTASTKVHRRKLKEMALVMDRE